MFLTVFPFFMLKSESLIHSFFILKSDLSDSLPHSLQKSDHQQFAQVAHDKEQWLAQVAHDKRATRAICSFSQVNHSFALSLTKSEQIAWKTDERIPNPGRNIPGILLLYTDQEDFIF